MRSTESGTAALQLGLGGPEIDRHEIGRRDRIADREARVSQSTDGRRRGSPPRWSDPPRIRRMDLVRGVAARLAADPRVDGFAVEAENFESIHNHSAYARITRNF